MPFQNSDFRLDPDQAVIFAGGRGARLGALTDSAPKPMMVIEGRPFLEHLILNLRRQGIRQVVLLTGYLKEQIRTHFESNPISGVEIIFSEGPEEWETAERLRNAATLLEDSFFILYADNYSVVDLSRLADRFRESSASLQLLLSAKSKGEISFDREGKVLLYDRSRTDPSCKHVEIGHILCKKSVVTDLLYNVSNQSFSKIIQLLVERGEVRAEISEHPYLSISDPDRLELTRSFFSPRKVLLLDRDGTINKKPTLSRYVRNLSEFEMFPEAEESIRLLAASGYSFIVITNQAGVATGDIRIEDLAEISSFLAERFKALGANLLDIFTSTDHWADSESPRRKPAPGMFIEASLKHQFRLDRAVYVGDDPRDMKAAERAGCGGIFLSDSSEPLDKVQLSEFFKARQLHIARDWMAVCEIIRSRDQALTMERE